MRAGCAYGRFASERKRTVTDPGIGRRCIRAMLDLAREKGMERVTANIYSFNAQSRNMFLSLGFRETGGERYALDL